MGRVPNEHSGRRRLLSEIQITFILITALTIAVVEIFLILAVYRRMDREFRTEAVASAEEIKELLLIPLYNVDDEQAGHIGEALLSSGRICGIVLESDVSGIIIDKQLEPAETKVLVINKDLQYRGFDLGNLELHFSNFTVMETIRSLIVLSIAVIITVVLIVLIFYWIILKWRIKDSLKSIMNGFEAIRKGDWEVTLEYTVFRDVNALIEMVNGMAASIREKNRELISINRNLEDLVSERTRELEESLNELKKTQAHLVESEKLGLLGQLSAGMAHELNTPLGAIQSSTGSVLYYLEHKAEQDRQHLIGLNSRDQQAYLNLQEYCRNTHPRNEIHWKKKKSIRKYLEDRGITRAKVLSDLLMELRLEPDCPVVAPILSGEKAEEILRIQEGNQLLIKMVSIIDMAVKRAGRVVSALRSYLSQESTQENGEVDINNDLEQVLLLMHNQLKHGVVVEKDFSDARLIGTSDKLSQVWINLIRNGIQAMGYRGTLKIKTETSEGRVFVSVIDCGHGIHPEIQDRIFEPFFTTKISGEGMGLGLDICKKIIESHGGTITFESRPGRTEFLVSLPVEEETIE